MLASPPSLRLVSSLVLALCAIALPACSAIVAPDTTRLDPSAGIDGGDPAPDGGTDPDPDGGTDPDPDGGTDPDPDGGPPPVDAGDECTGGPRCEGRTLIVCESGEPVVSECPLGCASDGTRCGTFVPSNVDESLWSAEGRDVVIEGMGGFDTSACASAMSVSRVVSQAGGPDACVLQVRNLTIGSAGVLRVVGARPLIVMATGDVDVSGIIDLGARLDTPGPGGGIGGRLGEADGIGPAGGERGEHVGTYDDGGGAGGSFCGVGGSGGGGGFAGGGSAPTRLPATFLSPLHGGSGGGMGPGGYSGGGGGPGNIGLGGAGGGAIQISAQGTIRVSGAILAGGGGGRGGGGSDAFTNYGAGGGGGSGGAILLEAPEVTFEGDAVLGASGAGGGGSASRDGDGGDGQDGRMTVGRAVGGESGGSTYGAAGGSSGGGATPDAEPGATNAARAGNGGGGGGGAGCIVVRNAEGALPAGTSTGWSPSSDGVAITTVRTR